VRQRGSRRMGASQGRGRSGRRRSLRPTGLGEKRRSRRETGKRCGRVRTWSGLRRWERRGRGRRRIGASLRSWSGKGFRSFTDPSTFLLCSFLFPLTRQLPPMLTSLFSLPSAISSFPLLLAIGSGANVQPPTKPASRESTRSSFLSRRTRGRRYA
jgi:hypothetical protein